jgi:hypothetical protein
MKKAIIKKRQRPGAKYYVYVSASKVEMLFGQFSEGFDVSLYQKTDRVIEHIHETERVGTVDDPTEYFAGTLDMKWGPYGLAGHDENVPEKYALDPLVFFSGAGKRTMVALCGSTKHLVGVDIGGLGLSRADSYSMTPAIDLHLRRRLELSMPSVVRMAYPSMEKAWRARMASRSDANSELVDAVAMASDKMVGPTAKLEFLARKLASGPARFPSTTHSTAVVLGTPIYVALAG